MGQKKGLSIVEVLVALTIMGIVAGVSVPNYTKMQRASKKAEAQSSLGQIYIAEKAFFLQWRYYTVDLVRIGAIPEGPLIYNVGFNGDGTITCSGDTCTSTESEYRGPTVDPKRKDFYTICGDNFVGTPAGTLKQCAFSYKKKNEYKGFEPPFISTISGEYDAKKDTFTAGAIANLVKKNSKECPEKQCDMWSINQFKQVKRECDDGSAGGDKCPY